VIDPGRSAGHQAQRAGLTSGKVVERGGREVLGGQVDNQTLVDGGG
jgi:hypothetical protein